MKSADGVDVYLWEAAIKPTWRGLLVGSPDDPTLSEWRLRRLRDRTLESALTCRAVSIAWNLPDVLPGWEIWLRLRSDESVEMNDPDFRSELVVVTFAGSLEEPLPVIAERITRPLVWRGTAVDYDLMP